jgi:hypothetical protein
MQHLFPLFKHLLPTTSLLLVVAPAFSQDISNNGSTITVEAGATLFVGGAGLINQAAGVVVNSGTLRVQGTLTNSGTLDLSSGSLDLRGNLQNSGTMLGGTSAVTFSGQGEQLLTSGGSSLFRVIVDQDTSNAAALRGPVRLTDDLRLSDALVLRTGDVNTQAPGGTLQTLRLGSSARLIGETSRHFVRGTVQALRTPTPGTATDFSNGAVLDATSNQLGNVYATRQAGLQTQEVSYSLPQGYKSIDQIWTLTPDQQPTTPVQLSLVWLSGNDNGLTGFTQAQAWQQPTANTSWTRAGAPTNATTRSLSFSTSQLSRFTVSNVAGPLAVKLVEFTARAEGSKAVRLAWKTSTEHNSAGFTAERSTDGLHFVPFAYVASTGSSSSAQHYTLLDTTLPAGVSVLYYRLAETDTEGVVSYLPTRVVSLPATEAGREAPTFLVYPSRIVAGQPATYLYAGPSGPATIQVVDMLGRVMHYQASNEQSQGQLATTGLAPGAYLVRYTTSTATFTSRCVIE